MANTAKMVGTNLVRVLIDSMRSGASIKIGLHAFAGSPAPDLTLPRDFQPNTYSDDFGGGSVKVYLQDSIQVWPKNYLQSGGGTAHPLEIVKTGTTPADFLITITNNAVDELTTGNLELYVRFH